MKPNGLMPGGEPFYFPGNDTGCLLSHGFTGAPQEVRWLGQHLAKQGYTVHGVRLTGHGTHVRDMGRPHWRDWYGSLLDGYNLLRQSCQRVFVLGLSMGGALSLLLGANEEVSSVVAMSTPYRLGGMQIHLAGLLRRVIFSVPKFQTDDLTQRVAQMQAERGERVTGHVNYDRQPLGAVVHLGSLLDEMRRTLPQVRVPLMLVHARHDSLIPMAHFRHIVDEVGSTDKETLVLERGGHVVTEDADHPLLFEKVAAHIAGRV